MDLTEREALDALTTKVRVELETRGDTDANAVGASVTDTDISLILEIGIPLIAAQALKDDRHTGPVIRAAMAQAWDEGKRAGIQQMRPTNPYRKALGTGDTDETRAQEAPDGPSNATEGDQGPSVPTQETP